MSTEGFYFLEGWGHGPANGLGIEDKKCAFITFFLMRCSYLFLGREGGKEIYRRLAGSVAVLMQNLNQESPSP